MSDPYIGEIRMFAGNFAPNGWLLCQGQLLAISDYDTLFNLIGTTYGGDGQQTFALPNLQSRYPVHSGPSAPLGDVGGAEQVSLSTTTMPSHTHAVAAAAAPATSASPSNAFWASWRSSEYRTSAPNAAMNPAGLGPSGSSQPHDNMPPFLAINFIISMFGIYPSPA
jgi:microcystin-dependent protein